MLNIKNGIFLIFLLSILGCAKEDLNEVEVATLNFTNINTTQYSAKFYYKCSSDLVDLQIIWSENQNVDINNYEKHLSIPNNQTEVEISNLEPNKIYYFKITAKKSNNQYYSSELKITTLNVDISLTDNHLINFNTPHTTPEENISIINAIKSENNIYILSQVIGIPGYEVSYEIIKTDTGGNKIWQFSINETVGTTEIISEIHELSDNNFVIIGATYIDFTSQQPYGTPKVFVIKFNNLGNILWKKYYPIATRNLYIRGSSSKNGMIKFAYGSGGIHSPFEQYSIDNDGNILDHKELNFPDNIFDKIYYNNDNSIINYGRRDQYPNDGLAAYEGLVEKYSENYNLEWIKLYGIYYGGDDSFDVIKPSTSNGYSIIGSYGGENRFDDNSKWILKLDQAGNMIWEKKETRNDFIYYGKDLIPYVNGDIIVMFHETYYPNYPAYDICSVTKYNAEGSILWNYKDGLDNNTDTFVPVKIFETLNNEFIILGNDNTTALSRIRLKRILIN
ncbi:hypothetical protein [Flavobacterium sp.]|uniref:hypothetical protein n=1 Tax=Flavobacterium sp. TaxID=239 RepID=UPI004048ABBD